MSQYISKQAIQFHIDGLDYRNAKPIRKTFLEIFIDWVTGQDEIRKELELRKKLQERITRFI
jgi:hypothetical protein